MDFSFGDNVHFGYRDTTKTPIAIVSHHRGVDLRDARRYAAGNGLRGRAIQDAVMVAGERRRLRLDTQSPDRRRCARR